MGCCSPNRQIEASAEEKKNEFNNEIKKSIQDIKENDYRNSPDINSDKKKF
jgi:iron-sulfur cluster repair protein YtfE (RIC family)